MSRQAEVAGAVVRAYLEELRSMGALEGVRPKLSADASRLADKPPLPVSWIEVRLAHEPLVLLRQQRGRDEVRAFARRVASGQIGTMIRPLLSSTLRFFGGTPASLFSRLDTMTAIMLRGVKFDWAATGPSAGTVGIEYPYPVDEALFATWEGMLHVAYDLAATPGTVGTARVGGGGERADIDLRW